MHLFNRFVTAFVCERGLDSRAVIGLLPQAKQVPARYSLLALAGGILAAVVIVLPHAG